MPRLNFGAFIAPHHPIGEHPMLQFRRDLDLVERLDKLGYGEFCAGSIKSFQRPGDDRVARDAPGRGGRAIEAHQARDRRDLPSLSPSVQRGAAESVEA